MPRGAPHELVIVVVDAQVDVEPEDGSGEIDRGDRAPGEQAGLLVESFVVDEEVAQAGVDEHELHEGAERLDDDREGVVAAAVAGFLV